MAEIIISALLPIVFEKLASVALNKFADRSKEIHSELKKWNFSLRQIRNLLNDAAQKEITDESVKDWLNRLQHVAYDIDDELDAIATDAMHRELTHQEPARNITSKVKKLIPTCCSSSTFSSSSTSRVHYRKLNDITTRLQQLYDEKNDLGLTVKDKGSLQDINNRRYQTSLLPPGIVGRDGEKNILLQKLLADHEPLVNQHNFSIVPIVGMGGIGKTTLARLLYNEPKVNQHFELKAWVCVSDEFDSFNISNLIFESVAGQGKKFENPNLFQEALRGQLTGKRFLLVLDDVWSEKIEDWDTLVPPFHTVAPGSKVIITTRKEQLLQQLGYDNPYHLNKLSHDDALSLFAQHALGANNFDESPAHKPYGEGIVQKCDGLPLALKALGSLLRTKTNEEKWKEFLESEIWSLKDGGGILPALRLSYLDLSACLKQLFAYSCLFPKDYVFDKEDLILLWMAEGFLLKLNNSKSMECLGEEYFDELLSRSFYQHVPNDESLFMMHDLMNDLATSVAGEFFIRLDIDMEKDISDQTLAMFRHMSFVREEFMAFKKFKAFERANGLRTFLAVPIVVRDVMWEDFYLSYKTLVHLLPRLPLLRALCLGKLQIDEIPESVGDLKHLRYLNLSQTPITHLPDNVCNLYNLQTLIVFKCYYLRKLPASFSKLKNLRHFDIRDTPLLKNLPLGIGEMKSLQTLSKINIGGENEFPISRLKNLKNLRQRVRIYGLDKLQNNDQAREVSVSQMRLSELVLEWNDVFDGSRKQKVETEVLDVLKPHSDNLKNLELVSYGGTQFPKWVTDPSFMRLTDVSFDNCRNCVFLPPLGQLSSLKTLSIKNMDEVKEVGSELLGNGLSVFTSLEILRFHNMPQWEVWSVNGMGDAVFPCLKRLEIEHCPNMARWEVFSANADVIMFPCLEELFVRSCPNLIEVSLEALPFKVLTICYCSDGALKSLVRVATSMRKLKIDDILGLSDEMWGDVVQHLGGLEELEIDRCNEIRNLWELRACKEVLVNLKKLAISRCGELVRLGVPYRSRYRRFRPQIPRTNKSGSHLEFSSTSKYQDRDGTRRRPGLGKFCSSLEESNLYLPTSLRMLEIRDCKNLKHLSCPDNIETLEVSSCENLEHLSCPPNNIQDFKMYYCSSITSVSFPTGAGGEWQKLRRLDIWSCSSILEKELQKHALIITNNTTNAMPILEVLYIYNSKDLESITKFTCLIQLTRLTIEECGRIESFPDLHDLVSLKHLRIMSCRSMDGPPPLRESSGGVSVWPPKLESLEIGELKRPISEWGPLPAPSIVELRLWGGFGSASAEEEDDDVKSFPTSLFPYSLSSFLTSLVLVRFKKMERISSEALQHLTSLQHLRISVCPKMKDLPETLLPSLLSLDINDSVELEEKIKSRSGSYWPLLSQIPRVTPSIFGY